MSASQITTGWALRSRVLRMDYVVFVILELKLNVPSRIFTVDPLAGMCKFSLIFVTPFPPLFLCLYNRCQLFCELSVRDKWWRVGDAIQASSHIQENINHFITSALLVTCDTNHIQQLMFSKRLPNHQISLNPLTPELNRSKQRCLFGFFTGDFKFYFLVLEKKAYLIVFSFKFNEIKFCILLVNWLIQKKIFTYFYNKIKPVNHLHYIKCGVNISLLT